MLFEMWPVFMLISFIVCAGLIAIAKEFKFPTLLWHIMITVLAIAFISVYIVWPAYVITRYDTEYDEKIYKIETVNNIDVICVDGEVLNMNSTLGRDFVPGDQILVKKPRKVYCGLYFILGDEYSVLNAAVIEDI